MISGRAIKSENSHQKALSRLKLLQLDNRPAGQFPPQQATNPPDPETDKNGNMKLLYPTSLELDIKSLEGFSVELVAYDVKEPLPESAIDAECLVTWTNTPDNLKDAANRMKKLQWIQSLAAGPNDVLSAGFSASELTICTGSGLHDRTVAEHALGLLLTAARRFHEMRDYQLQGKWPGHLGGPQPDRPAGKFTTLRDARVLIWGFGNIAKTLAPWLTSLGAHVRGIARHAGVRDGVEVYGEDKLSELLPETDALVMILPGSDATKQVLNAERLKQLPNHAWVVNVGEYALEQDSCPSKTAQTSTDEVFLLALGRGTCVDDEALISALDKDEIGGAALDVFTTEPLPESSPYWKQKNVVVSPHAAGGRPQGAETLIAENLRRFVAGQDLKNVI